MVNVTFPTTYRQFLSWVKVFELDLGWVSTLGCRFRINFYHRLLAATISPLVALSFLGFTFWLARRRHGHDNYSMAKTRRRHLAAVILVTFLIYSTASSLVFQTFSCDSLDDGRSYLRADYSLVCHVPGRHENDVHRRFMVYAGLMILVYPLGIPALYAFLLYWYRRRRTKADSQDLADTVVGDTVPGDEGGAPARMSLARQESILRAHEALVMDLWKPYRDERSYFEVVECIRRVALTGMVVFLFPGSVAQISITFLISLAFFVLSEALSPYADPHDSWMSRFGHVLVLLSMFLALMVKVDLSGESETDLRAYSVALLVANVAMASVVAGESILSVIMEAAE